jgi:hypothetical protein
MLSAFGLQQMDYSDGGGAGFVGIAVMLVELAIAVVVIAGLWKIFTKAGEPGWAAIVPIYGTIVLLKIAGKPAWWFILFLIPGVSLIVWILVAIELAKRFGQSTGYGIGLALLSVIFIPMLGFGSAAYQGAVPTPGFAPARA